MAKNSIVVWADMKPSEREGFRKKLESDLETVAGEVRRLFSQRRVFEVLTQVFRDNPALSAAPTQLHTFLFGGYVGQASLRLRRLMDKKPPKGTVSPANIVKRLCDHSNIITRSEYVGMFTRNVEVSLAGSHDPGAADRLRSVVVEDREREAKEFFDQFAGRGRPSLDPERISNLYEPTRCKCEKVLTYVNKRLAHYDREIPEDPTWGELDEAIDAVGDLYVDVQLLLTGVVEERDELAGTWQGAAWEPLLEVPWRTPPPAEEDVLPSN